MSISIFILFPLSFPLSLFSSLVLDPPPIFISNLFQRGQLQITDLSLFMDFILCNRLKSLCFNRFAQLLFFQLGCCYSGSPQEGDTPYVLFGHAEATLQELGRHFPGGTPGPPLPGFPPTRFSVLGSFTEDELSLCFLHTTILLLDLCCFFTCSFLLFLVACLKKTPQG